MKAIFYFLSVLGVSVLCVGCQSASYHSGQVQKDSGKSDRLTVGKVQREIKVGMSSADVVGVLGSPNIVTSDDKHRESWVYDKIATNASYSKSEGGIFLILGGVSGASGAGSTSQRTLTIIIKFDDVEINSKSEFEEELSHHYPGEKITFTYLREGKPGIVNLTLVNKTGGTSLIKRKIYSDAMLGAELEEVDYGVKVYKIKDGLFKRLGVPENYTIISINRQRIKDPQEVIDFFQKYRGRVLLYGINSSKQEYPLQFTLQ